MELKNTRAQKGLSTLDFPKDYVVVDIETTGLSPSFDSIIELSALKVIDNKIVNEFSSLIKPSGFFYEDDDDEPDPEIDYLINEDGERYYFLDPFITRLTGITNKMLESAEPIESVLPTFLDFVGKAHIIGHNVNFDINFIYDNCINVLKKPFSNNFTDTMRISRKVNKDLSHHRLLDLAEKYKLSYDGAHRALTDCKITQKCYLKLYDDIITQYQSIEEFKKSFKSHNYSKQIDISAIKTTKETFDETHPLFQKYVCFTGTLEKMVRKDAMQIVVDFGGIIEKTVTQNTNFLILGNNDYCSTIKDGKSTKHKKAESLILKGQDIQIIPENVFYDMISE